MKVVERVAKGIAEEHFRYLDGETWPIELDTYEILYTSPLEFAQTVIGELGIIILPKDEKPREGDLLLSWYDSKEEIYCWKYKKDDADFLKTRSYWKIIMRDGKLVIQEEE